LRPPPPATGCSRSATRRLLDLGADLLIAIEPDAQLADYLEESILDAALKALRTSFEEADLEDGASDLGISVTAFYWRDETPALENVAWLLKPSGWWAAIWHIFGDADLFHDRAAYFALDNRIFLS